MSLQTVPLYKYYALFTTLLKFFVSRAEENSSIIRFSEKSSRGNCSPQHVECSFNKAAQLFSLHFFQIFCSLAEKTSEITIGLCKTTLKLFCWTSTMQFFQHCCFLLKVQTSLLLKLRKIFSRGRSGNEDSTLEQPVEIFFLKIANFSIQSLFFLPARFEKL